MKKQLEEKMLYDIMELVRIPSVYSEGSFPGAPFGRAVAQCLEKTLEIGKKLGFQVKNYDGYVGEMDMGHGPVIVGILGHCDVVPAGEGWDSDPFAPKIINGRIYGRGSSDDKGPLVACMYAVKKLNDEGKIPKDVTIRVIVGTNEEEDWNDIPYYIERAKNLPCKSIVPDAEFPLIYCEKGLYDIDIIYNHPVTSNKSDISLDEFEGGSARNAVAAKARAVLEVNEKENIEAIVNEIKRISRKLTYDCLVDICDSKISVTVFGKNAHAMNPDKGVNAGVQLISILDKLAEKGKCVSHRRFTKEFCRLIGDDYKGEKCGISCSDGESGCLTMSIGTYSMGDDGSIRMKASIRYPSSFDFEKIRTAVYRALNTEVFTVEEVSHMKPVYFKEDDDFIQMLMDVYREVTGDKDTKPLAIGGATYARAIPNAVGFGPVFPYEAELAHEPNEFASIDSLIKAQQIYYRTLERICKSVSSEEGDSKNVCQ